MNELRSRLNFLLHLATAASRKLVDARGAFGIRLLAERQMGAFLATMPKNTGAKGSVVSGSVREPVKDETPTLREIGLTKKQSATAQKLAAIPAEEFHARVAVAKIAAQAFLRCHLSMRLTKWSLECSCIARANPRSSM